VWKTGAISTGTLNAALEIGATTGNTVTVEWRGITIQGNGEHGNLWANTNNPTAPIVVTEANGTTHYEYHNKDSKGSLIKVSKTGTLKLASILENHKTNNSGAGVYVSDGELFIESGGTLQNLTACVSGGGIYYSGGTALGGDAADGSHLKNLTAKNGGGLFIYKGTFTLKLGSILEYAQALEGGGLHLTGGSAALKGTMSNLFTTPEANAHGAGVYIEIGTFTMKDGSVMTHLINRGTGSGSSGGGVFVGTNTGAVFQMWGGTISDANAPLGGGVYVANGGTFTMKQVTTKPKVNITMHSMDAEKGGGVYVAGVFNMTDVTMHSMAADKGGGVYVANGGAFTMSGVNSRIGPTGTGEKTVEALYGGGVYSAGTFTMTAGTIAGSAKYRGGGVYVSETGTFRKTGGTIEGYNNTGYSSYGTYGLNYIGAGESLRTPKYVSTSTYTAPHDGTSFFGWGHAVFGAVSKAYGNGQGYGIYHISDTPITGDTDGEEWGLARNATHSGSTPLVFIGGTGVPPSVDNTPSDPVTGWNSTVTGDITRIYKTSPTYSLAGGEHIWYRDDLIGSLTITVGAINGDIKATVYTSDGTNIICGPTTFPTDTRPVEMAQFAFEGAVFIKVENTNATTSTYSIYHN
jgi:hypothetical protein